MSAPYALAFYGIRVTVTENEIAGLETHGDPMWQAAHGAGLKMRWGSFDGAGGHLLLFIGAELGMLGPEHEFEAAVSGETLDNLVEDTARRLRRAGFHQPPALHLQWSVGG